MTDTSFQRLQDYVGTPYVLGQFDCMDLAARVMREVFGREIALPPNRPRPMGSATQRGQIAALRDEVAVKVDVPFTGCAALLVDGGQWHIGVVGVKAGECWVLHNSHKLGSAHFQRLSHLERLGPKLDGYYAWL